MLAERTVWTSLFAGVVVVAVFPPVSNAQIVTDGSVGPSVTLNGLDVEIEEALGSRVGNNLFHSFESFNIQTNGTATFTGATDIDTVVSRVTGGQISNIGGVLRSEIGNANFYFINPAGVIFSEGGSIDVPASFHLSTADELRFADGSELPVTASSASTLSMAAVEAFGFLGDGGGAISIDGNIVVGEVLDSTTQESMTIVAGNIALGDTSEVQAPGSIHLAAVGEGVANYNLAQGAQVSLEGTLEINGLVGFSLFTPPDNVLIEAGEIAVSGPSATLFSGSESSMRLISSELKVGNGGSVTSQGTIDVQASNQVSITNGGRIGSSPLFGESAAVTVSASQLLIDREGSSSPTGIFNDAFINADAGNIEVSVEELVTLQNGGLVSSTNFGVGNAGCIALSAGQLVVDGEGSDGQTGIFANGSESTGGAGSIELAVTDTAIIQSGGRLSTNTFGAGDAGNILVTAGQLTIDSAGRGVETGINSNTFADATGNTGAVEVIITEITTLQNRGNISTNTVGQGNAGNIALTSGELLIVGQGSDGDTGVLSRTVGNATGSGGDVQVTVSDMATIQSGGSISSESFGSGNAGNVVMAAGQLLVDRQGLDKFTGIFSNSTFQSSGNVEVTISGMATIQNGGQISSSTSGEASAGDVLFAAGNLLVDDQGSNGFTGIFSDVEVSATGNSGDVDVTVSESATIQDGGRIGSTTFGEGNAGDVAVNTGELLIDGQDRDKFTGIFSDTGSSGNAGRVTVRVAESATVENSGSISSTTFNEGSAGSVDVSAGEIAIIQNGGIIRSDTFGAGDAGNIALSAGRLNVDRQNSEEITGITSDAAAGSTGNAGGVEVIVADSATIQDRGIISSSTFSEGDAGAVTLSAGNLVIEGSNTAAGITGIDSSANAGTTGNAGSVEVIVQDAATLQNGGLISSDTFGSGDAGDVVVTAGQLLIDRQGSTNFTGISSEVLAGATGNAGSVEVTIAEVATIQNGGQITSNTLGEGGAGSVLVTTGQLLIDGVGNPGIDTGIFSASANTGNAGTVEVNIEELAIVKSNGQISTSAFGQADAGNVTINSAAGTVILSDNALVSSSAAGPGSDSGSVVIDSGGRFTVDSSSLNTVSVDGSSGSINVTVDILDTSDAQITTTSESPTADGGDITINSEVFVLETTVIQANATSGTGGEINIDTAIVPFGNQFNTQLDSPLNLNDPQLSSFGNVAQAVAPTGVSVPPEINSPEVDVSGALSDLDSELLETPKIGADPCSVAQSGSPSTLIDMGRGALPDNKPHWSPSVEEKLNESQYIDTEVYFIELDSPLDNRYAYGTDGCRYRQSNG